MGIYGQIISSRTTTDSSACHFSFLLDQACNLFLNSSRKTTKTKADPIMDPDPAMKKPFMPYAKPARVHRVLCPVKGGNEIMTNSNEAQYLQQMNEKHTNCSSEP